MRRCSRELTLDIGRDDARRSSQPTLNDRRPPPSTLWTQQRRRRSTGTRQQLMGCMSGQRSPTTPTTEVALFDARKPVCSSRPPIDPRVVVRERHSPRPSKCYRPTLSVYSDQVVSGNSTLVSSAAAAAAAAAESSVHSAGDSGIDVNTSASFEKDEVDRRASSASGRGRDRSTKTTSQFAAEHSAPLSTRQVEQSETEVDSRSKRDRKSRSQSPAALWRSISSSSLMRSLSRRRAASRSRRAADDEGAASRSKLSSLDTDSDCENRDAAGEQTRRRRVRGGSSSGIGGSLTGLGLEATDSRHRCETIAALGGDTRRRRSGIFGVGRSLRRAQITSTDEDLAVSQSATLPRRRRCNDERSSDWPGSSRLSSRASSFASLRRSQTSESLSLLKTQILQLSNGFNLVKVSSIFVCHETH